MYKMCLSDALITSVFCLLVQIGVFSNVAGSNVSTTIFPQSTFSGESCKPYADCLYDITRCVQVEACSSALGLLLQSNGTYSSYSPSEFDPEFLTDAWGCIRSTNVTSWSLNSTQASTSKQMMPQTSTVSASAAQDFLCGPGCISSFDYIQICAFSACSLRMTQCTHDPTCLEVLIAMQVNPRAAQYAQLDYPLIYLTLSCIDVRCETNFLGYAETSNTTQCEYSSLDVTVMQTSLTDVSECSAISATIATSLLQNTSHNLGPILSDLYAQNMSNASLCDCLYAVDNVDATMLLGRCIPSGSVVEAPHDIVNFCSDIYSGGTTSLDPKTPSESLCDAACDSCRCTRISSCICPKCRERSISQSYIVDELDSTEFSYDVPGPVSDRTEYVCLQDEGVADLVGFNFSVNTFRVDASFSFLGNITNETWGSLARSNLEQFVAVHARITDIEPGALESLSDLYILEIRTNLLTMLKEGMLSGLNKLNRLDLAENAITYMETGVFDDVPVLEALWLGSNRIRTLQSGIFGALTSLLVLRLDHNEITMLPAAFLSNSTQLERATGSANAIMRIPTALFHGFTNLNLFDLTDNIISTCDAERDEFGTVTAFVCQDCAGDLPVLEDLEAAFQVCTPFAISNDPVCADRLRLYRQQFVNVTYCSGDTVTINAISSDCNRSTLFERYAFDDADAITLQVMVVSLTDSLLPTICTGNDGRMTMTGLVEGVFDVTLSARDAAGSVVTMLTWEMHVINKVLFARTDAPWPLLVLDTVNNSILHDTTKLALDVTYKVLPPMNVETDVAALSNYFRGDTANVVFQIVVDTTGDRRETGSALVDSSVGYILCHFTEPGNYSIQLLAINGGMSTVVHVISELDDGIWGFEVLHRDVEVPEYGPNGLPCSNNGEPVDDGNEFDQSYTCSCRNSFEGPNCQVATESTMGKQVLHQGMWISLLFVVVLVLLGLYILHRYKLHKAQVRFAKPHNFDNELTLVNERGLKVKRDGTDRMRHPLELKRHQIKCVDGDILGEGEYGVVHKGVYTRSTGSRGGRELTVAVKVLKANPSDEERTALYREAAITAQFEHANVIGLVGVVTVKEPFLIVLDYCAKGSLKHVLSTSTSAASVETLLGYCKGISQGMAYLARLRFVHRDLATRNVLVAADDVVKVADFGLSRKYNKMKDYYKLSGKMVLPMLWTCPENFPPIVTRGVNEPSSGDEVPKYDERTDMWAFGCCIWEVLTYGQDPYGNKHKLLDNLKRIYAGYRLEAPLGSNKDLVNMMTQCFQERAERPVFQATTAQLNALVAAQGGKSGVRDLGLLLHEQLTHKLMRKATVVASTRRASAAGLSNEDITKVAAKAMKSISEEYGFGDNEEEEMLAETTAAANSMAPSGRKSLSPSKWGQVRAVLPFLTFHSKWVKDHTGKVVRDVDHTALPPSESEIDENPFLSDDSDTDLDEVLESAGPSRETTSSPLALTSRTISIVDPSDQQSRPLQPGGGAIVRPEHNSDSEEEEEEEEIDGFPDLEDDVAILQLMAHRREQHAVAEAKRQEEIRAAYLRQKAIDDRIFEEDMAKINAEKQRDREAAEAEKQRIHEEAQERLAKDLRFSFAWAQ
eukprot:m.1305530 g.1305530  ORF g.1305530 m.1305530 type:complete len:1596 (+) comp24813_c0_seq24:427-5214(+)